jgi:excisionase family DNA binding protein
MTAYLSARESADYCGVSEKTIRNWIASGRLSAEKSAGSFRIAPDDLDALRSGSPHPPQSAESASAEVRAEGSPHGADSADPSAMVELIALVRELQAQLITRTEAAVMWQERARVLADQLALPPPAAEAPTAPAPIESPDTAPGPSAALYARLLAVLAVLVVVLMAAGVLLTMPR